MTKAPDKVKKSKRADKTAKKGDYNSNDNKTDKMDKSAPDQSLYDESRLGKHKKKRDKKSDLGDKKSKSTKNKKDLTDNNSQVGNEKREGKRPKPNYVRPGQKPFLFNMPPLMGGMGIQMGGINQYGNLN